MIFYHVLHAVIERLDRLSDDCSLYSLDSVLNQIECSSPEDKKISSTHLLSGYSLLGKSGGYLPECLPGDHPSSEEFSRKLLQRLAEVNSPGLVIILLRVSENIINFLSV